MKLNKTIQQPALMKGQFWKTSKGNVEIMEVGKTLAHYRLFMDEKRVPTRMGGIDMVQDYIRKNKGKLSPNPRLKKPDAAT